MRVVVAGTAVLVALASGCGSPSEVREFRFTPVAYTVIAGPGGTPWAVARADRGGLYRADEIELLVRNGRLSDIERLLDTYGFDHFPYLRLDEERQTVLVVRVPAGGALAAQALFAATDGVLAVQLNSLQMVDERVGTSVAE